MAAVQLNSAPQRILILKPSSLGDIVHTLPALAAVRAHWPESEIAWLVNPEWAPLLAGNPALDRVIEFPRRQFRGVRGWFRIPHWLHTLGNWTPDLALDFQGLLRTALIARFMGAHQIIGLSDAREGASFFYHQTVRLPRRSEGKLHAVDRYLKMIRALDIGEIERPVFHLPEGTPPATDLPASFLLFHPFSRGEGKSMEPDDVLRFCRAIPIPVVLVGGAQSLEHLPENVYNLLGQTTLHELIWLIRHAAYTVSVDSGPMHIAAALTDRLLSLHTWSDPLLVGPYNGDAWIWKNGRFCQMGDYISGNIDQSTFPSPTALADFLSERGLWIA